MSKKSENYEARRARVASDVEEFLAGGGVIEKVSHAATSDRKLTVFEQPVNEPVLSDIDLIIAKRKK